MREEAEVGEIVGTNDGTSSNEFTVVEEVDLAFHFADGFFDGHKVCFYVIDGILIRITDIGGYCISW